MLLFTYYLYIKKWYIFIIYVKKIPFFPKDFPDSFEFFSSTL
jgi:hypothetical protein